MSLCWRSQIELKESRSYLYILSGSFRLQQIHCVSPTRTEWSSTSSTVKHTKYLYTYTNVFHCEAIHTACLHIYTAHTPLYVCCIIHEYTYSNCIMKFVLKLCTDNKRYLMKVIATSRFSW